MAKPKKLNKELKLFNVFAIATGTTLSAGFFLLPGMAAKEAGPAMILAYLIATIPLIPAMFSIIELCTAMPKAGGIYYFLDRGLGPLFGTIGGLGTWLALIMKVAFALIGMGFYIALFVPNLNSGHIKLIAIGLAFVLGILNLTGAKKTGGFQNILVIMLLAILTVFIGFGAPTINTAHFDNFFDAGFDNIISTAGMVYISYVGVTSVASLSEEVQDPERNLPIGIILSLITAIVVYALGTIVMVGHIPPLELKETMTPVAIAAADFLGRPGMIIISFAAIMAFTSVANAGTMSASRFPMALSRDNMLPPLFKKINKNGIPINSIVITITFIIAILLLLDPLKIAKLASSFQLLMFALVCVTVIVMRESGIESYDPGYKSPFYPWLQIAGIITPIWFIFEMGWLSTVFSLGLVTIGIVWYFYYAKDKVDRNGAIFHIFEKLGKRRYDGLDYELREILKEKGIRKEDPFDSIIMDSPFIDLKNSTTFEKVTVTVSKAFSRKYPELNFTEVHEAFLHGNKFGATPVIKGIALPHFRSDTIDTPKLVIVRNLKGVEIFSNITEKDQYSKLVTSFAMFFLISPKNNPAQHLRILAQIAEHVEANQFEYNWRNAINEQDVKELLIRNDYSVGLTIHPSNASNELIGKYIYETKFPDNCLIAMLRRNDKLIIPKGNTVLESGDRLTIIGESESLKEIRERFL